VLTTILLVVAVLVLLLLASSVRMVQQYQRGVVLRFGRLQSGVRQPGLRLMVPVADRMVKVPILTKVMDVPPQGAIHRRLPRIPSGRGPARALPPRHSRLSLGWLSV
jgi:regulator of protease activity HflC (stomatin/prohibitin superfamily)